MQEQSRTLLCVDDEISILHALKRLLRKENYKVLIASSGKEGIKILSKEQIQVIVSDQRMPEMTGTEFLSKAKELHPYSIRVVLSGYADANTIMESINRGEIYRFLSKPWSDDELKTTIKQCFQHYDLLAENRDLIEKIQKKNKKLDELNTLLRQDIENTTTSLGITQEIISHVPLPILGVTAEGFIVVANNKAIDMFSKNYPLVIGESIDTIFPQILFDNVKQCLEHHAQKVAKLDALSTTANISPLALNETTRGCLITFEQDE